MRVLSVSPAVVVVVLAVVAGAVGGCPAADPCADKVVYESGGSDEVLLTMNDAKARATADANSPVITSPAQGQKLPASGPALQITWTSPIKIASSLRAPLPAHHGHAPGLFDLVASAVIPSARAHEPPVSSDVYVVELAVPEQQCPVTIVTTELSHTLDAATWGELAAAAGKPLTLSITSAYLEAGRINEGPFKAAPVTFEVQ